jgi:hypothetical protein
MEYAIGFPKNKVREGKIKLKTKSIIPYNNTKLERGIMTKLANKNKTGNWLK